MSFSKRSSAIARHKCFLQLSWMIAAILCTMNSCVAVKPSRGNTEEGMPADGALLRERPVGINVDLSCIGKLMRSVNITERQSPLYEKTMMIFSRKNVNFSAPGLSDALLPLIFRSDAGKAERFLQCLRHPAICQEHSPCHHHGRCMFHSEADHYVCDCPRGYTGAFCGKETSPCESHPCMNGGMCYNNVTTFTCQCQIGYIGPTCNDQANPCESRPCMNGGTCRNNVTSFTCQCPIHYDGPTCNDRWFSKSLFSRIVDTLEKLTWSLFNMQQGNMRMEHKINSLQSQTKVLNEDLKKTKIMLDISRGLDGGGWRLVWKHSYFQVNKSDLNKMKTFSSFRKPCFSLSDGWCNEPNKRDWASQQMTVAYHKRQVVYAYRGDLNPELGKTWRGAILKNPVKIVDKCTRQNGIPPEPSRTYIPGITFDKVLPGVYTYNCDTAWTDYTECRWHDCYLPSSISPKAREVQMTVAIFVR